RNITSHWFYTLSLHDALPILVAWSNRSVMCSPVFKKRFRKLRKNESALGVAATARACCRAASDCESSPTRREGIPSRGPPVENRSEEHTSELQSRGHLVCRLL